jgi:hypothetical protein
MIGFDRVVSLEGLDGEQHRVPRILGGLRGGVSRQLTGDSSSRCWIAVCRWMRAKAANTASAIITATPVTPKPR